MKENETNFYTQSEDDYTALLPVFKYPDDAAAQSTQATMDDIIKKNSIVIQLHPKSKWVDDCYFLIGKSNFYKHNYQEALTSFQYIISEYSNTGKKKKKKKKSNDAGMSVIEKLQHQPVHNEASLWVVRTLIEMKEYNTANTALSVIKSDKKFPETLLGELYAVEADASMKQGDYASAIEPLSKSIENINNETTKARYHFILSQLYHNTEEDAKAIDELKAVIDLKPDYKMDFYARLMMAQLMMENYNSASGTAKMLSDMLKQEKYKEFYSLLYNTLAGIEMAAGNKDKTVEYLHLATAGEGDAYQKAIAYMKLGDIKYELVEYVPAYSYYDSCLISLPKEQERYEEIILRRDGLYELVKELKIIETEKKLQYLATLNEKQLEEELAKMVTEVTEENEQDFLESSTAVNTTTTNSTTFYFYDAGMRSRGYSEFKKTYGNRKLEDNWRRSDKTSSSEEDEVITAAGDLSDAGKTIDLSSSDITREDILQSIPRTDEQKTASNARIASALYNSGRIYKANFNNYEKAKENFSENISAYPKNSFELQALYQMYLLTDGSKKEEYKSAIITKYPGSLFANIIQDPDYLTKQAKKDAVVEAYYTSCYRKYETDSISALTTMLARTDSLFKTNPLKPKFEMLSALTLAKQFKEEEFVTALQGILKKYPLDETGKKAKEILAAMGKDTKEEKKTESGPVNYTFKPEEEQYFIAVINVTGKEASSLKTNITNFNGVNFSVANLKVSSLLLGKDKTLVMIKSFKGVSEAMHYYTMISESSDITKDLTSEEVFMFLISKSNYVQFYKSKDVNTYYEFFDANYLNEEDDE